MAKTKPGKPPKPTRAEKKVARADARKRRGDQFRAMKQAFTMTRKNDSRLIPYMIIAFVVPAAAIFCLLHFVMGWLYLAIIPSILVGALAALVLFSRRAQSTAYNQAEGQPGAAAYVLTNMRGDWRVSQAVAANSQLDAVHRVIGRPGIVLIGEGAPQRVRALLAQEKKRTARIAGDTPIYDVVAGSAEGGVPLRKLQRHLMTLPRNLDKVQVGAVERRLQALGTPRPPLPQGPMPGGGKMSGMQRTVRRRS